MDRYLSPTALTDTEWSPLGSPVPAPQARGRPRRHAVRDSLHALCSSVRSGCAWRRMPHELPPWQMVSHDLRRWVGVWESGHTALRAALRVQAGRAPQPSAAMLESPSVKTAGGGGVRGDAGAKELRGRQRHLLVDPQGLVLRATVPSATVQDRAAGPVVREGRQAACPRRGHVWGDPGYTGGGKAGIEAALRWRVEVGRQPPKPRDVWAPMEAVSDWAAFSPQGFRGVLPRRWDDDPADAAPLGSYLTFSDGC
jgi:putative transposase